MPSPDPRLRKARAELMCRLGSRVDPASPVGRMLHQMRADLVEDLGGPDQISAAESLLVDTAVRTALILNSIDAWILEQPSLLTKGAAPRLMPIVRDRTVVAEALGRTFRTIGLRRRERPAVDLEAYLDGTTEAPRRPGGPPQIRRPPRPRRTANHQAVEATEGHPDAPAP